MNLFRDITHKIRRTLDRADILSAVSTEIAQRFEADRCLVFLPSTPSSTGRSSEPSLRCVCEGVNSPPPQPLAASSTRSRDDTSNSSSPGWDDAEDARLLGRDDEEGSDDEDQTSSSVLIQVDRRDAGDARRQSPPATISTRLRDTHAHRPPAYTASPLLAPRLSNNNAATATPFLDVFLPRSHSVVDAALQSAGAIVETSVGELFRGREEQLLGSACWGDGGGCESDRDRAGNEIAFRTALVASIDLGKMGQGLMVLVLRPTSQLSAGRTSLFADIAEQTGIALQQANMMETERVRTEELAERNATLQMVQKEIQVAREQKDFTAVMSHEMRTPLFAISALSSMILDLGAFEERVGLEEVEEMLNVIKSSGDMLISIVNNILDFSKYEDDQFCLDRSPFVLRDAVEGSAELVAMQDVDGRFPQIVLVISRDLPLILVGDITRFRQIIVNLLSNACKFTGPEGDVVVSVSRAEGRSKADDDAGLVWLRVTVVDSGIGIAEDTAGMLFEKFTQADASITRKFGGTGLGLAIARQLCQLMKGEISARPNVGEPGTTFEFTVCLQAYEPREWEAEGRVVCPCSYTLMNPKYDGFVIGVIEERVKSWIGLKEKLLACGNIRMIHYPDINAMLESVEPVNGVILDYRTVLLLNGVDVLRSLSCSPVLGPRTLLLLTAHFRRCPTVRVRRSQHDRSMHRGRPLKMADLTGWLDSLHALGAPVSVRERLEIEERYMRSGGEEPPGPQLKKLQMIESGTPPRVPVAGPVAAVTGAHQASAKRRVSAGGVVLTETAPKVSTGVRSASTGSLMPHSPLSFAPSTSSLSTSTGASAMSSSGSTVVGGGSTLVTPAATTPTTVPRLSVLVVEDNKVNQLVIGKILTKLGHSYELADDGEQGLRMVEAKFAAGGVGGGKEEERGRMRGMNDVTNQREASRVVGTPDSAPPPGPAQMYDVILMDIMMPNLDGRTATKEIRAVLGNATGPWIIGLSANAFWEERMLCFECGMNDFIAKPASMEDIRSAFLKFWSLRKSAFE
ncbi:hypothetical protein HK101_002780 [Irineochytrium annulatum]|nr:hypothetical protein HK101_002780 [Irineochytrium annulatum]